MIGESSFVERKGCVGCKRKKLNKDCISMIKKADTEGTRANHRTHHRAYLRFCDDFNYVAFPATEWQIVQYAMYLANESKRPETIQNYVGTVRVLH